MAISASRLISGLFLSIVGVILIILSIVISLIILIYGIPVLLIGLLILFNKTEDKIERRRDLKEKEYKQ